MTKIEPAFVVATQNENGSRNFICAFIGDSKEQLDKAIACARENGEASVWSGKTGQMRYNDACTKLEPYMFDATEMAQWATELAWYKGSLCGRFEFDPTYGE